MLLVMESYQFEKTFYFPEHELNETFHMYFLFTLMKNNSFVDLKDLGPT